MMLILPIPQNKQVSDKYYYVPYSQDLPSVRSKYILKKKDSIHKLRSQIATQMGVDPWSFVIGRINDEDLEELHCWNKTIGDVSESKGVIFAYEIPKEISS